MQLRLINSEVKRGWFRQSAADHLDRAPVPAQHNIRLEVPINGGGCDGEDPRCGVHHRLGPGPVVPGGARDGDPSRHSMKSADGDGVLGEIGEVERRRAEGNGEEVDAVGYCIVEAGEDGGAGAPEK